MNRNRRALAGTLLIFAIVATACTPGRNRAVGEREAGREAFEELLPAGRPEPVEEVNGRYDWYYGQRMAPGTTLPAAGRLAALQQARLMEEADADAVARGVAAPQDTWRNLGPKPSDSGDLRYNDPGGGTPPLGWHHVAGRIAAIAVHPARPEVVYIGGADGGVWKTTNGGISWRPVGDELDSLAIGALAIDRNRPDTVYAGTGEASTNADSYYGVGVYRTDDAGLNWRKLGGSILRGATVFKIVIGKNSNRLLVATNRGLFRSTDRGRTFERVLYPGGDADPYGNFITDVVYLHNTREQVLAAVGWRGSPGGGANANNGLWLSTDQGQTFTKLNPAGYPAQQNRGRTSLAVSKLQTNLIYAVIQDAQLMNTAGSPTVLNGVYKTTTGPNGPWVQVANTETYSNDENSALHPGKIGPGYQPGIQAWYDQYVEIDPADPDHVVVGLEEIYDTTDGGTTWDTIGRYWNFCLTNVLPNCNLDPDEHPTTHPDQHAAGFGIVEDGVSKLYAVNDGGIWSQVGPELDNDSWTNLNRDLSLTQFYYAEASAGPNPIIVGGTQDNGNQQYEGSSTWALTYGGDGGDVAIEPDNPLNQVEEYVYLAMAKTTNGGQTWTAIDTPDSNDSTLARFIAPFDLDPIDDMHLVALGRSVWESHSGIGGTTSSSWVEAYDQGASHLGTALAVRGDLIYTGWCGPCNPDTLLNPAPFARGMASNVGGTWHALAADGLPNRYVTGIAIDPADEEHIFVTLSGFSRRWIPNPEAGTGHVFESTDGGETFTDISADLPDAPANDALLFDGDLIVASDVGVYIRTDAGRWRPVGRNLPNVSVLDISTVPGGSTLIAATHGRGVWSLSL